MIQFEILNGTRAGTRWVARRFPFKIGREKDAALSLSDHGMWDSHLEVSVRPGEGCLVSARPEPLTLVNGHPIVQATRLRNGDIIEAGSVKLRFGLAPTGQRGIAVRETLTWLAISLLCLAQIVIIYRFLP